ncbi:MAG: hypothetical protein ACRCSQ_00430 [Bacteroidales bacterium]
MNIRIVHVLIVVAILLLLSMFLMAYAGTEGSNTIYWLLSVSALINIALAIILFSKNKKNK